MISSVLQAAATIPTLTARVQLLEKILHILNNPAKNAGTILLASVVLIVLPLTGLCYLIKKLYEKHFPE